MMGFGMGFGWIFSLILIAFGIWAIVQAVQKRDESPLGKVESPMDILKKRYARGEISKDEYERMKNDLQN